MTKVNKISPLEFLIQGIIICVAIMSMGLVTRWWALNKSYPGDFIICYRAAEGIFDPLPAGNAWLWKEWVAVIFRPFLLLDLFRATLVFAGIQTLCFMTLAHKMMEVRFGWILVLLVIPNFQSLLQVGNIQVSLCLAAVYPLPALLAILVKPHHFVFAVGLAVAARYRALNEDRKHLHKAG